VLEVAPGAGRNTEKLVALAQELHAIDLNEYALVRLRKRFADYRGPCKLAIHQNDGTSLAMLPDGRITFIYCFDSAVHFARPVLKAYLQEFARILKPGGTGFVHHSDLGATAHEDFRENPHCRSNVDREFFAACCRAYGLEVVQQRALPWPPPSKGVLISDCLSVLRRPS
jgi:ubiquinone/menaquinone biosynthesis C-methylase UbiE